jgi:hypothetical protein
MKVRSAWPYWTSQPTDSCNSVNPMGSGTRRGGSGRKPLPEHFIEVMDLGNDCAYPLGDAAFQELPDDAGPFQ